jgi:hypothetical protein
MLSLLQNSSPSYRIPLVACNNKGIIVRTFTPSVDWDPQAYLRRGFGMFRGSQEVVVAVEFDGSGARAGGSLAYAVRPAGQGTATSGVVQHDEAAIDEGGSAL